MSTYSVAQVEQLTGIKAHTLRIWERRYGIINPLRTSTNIRYYSDDQLKKLLNIAILIRNGHRISKLDKMSDQEIYDKVTDILEAPSAHVDDEIKSLTMAMLNLDEQKFDEVFNKQVEKIGLITTVTDIIYPFLHHVGVLWGTNQAMPAQEHFISNLIRQKIITATDALEPRLEDAPRIIMFLPGAEHHEIGLLLGAYLAKKKGYQVYYLGQNVPLDNLPATIDLVKPDLLMTMLVAPHPSRSNSLARWLTEVTDRPVMIAGTGENLEAIEWTPQLLRINSPHDLMGRL